jgi:drug/metabolite transporter superfamily protein YnfA
MRAFSIIIIVISVFFTIAMVGSTISIGVERSLSSNDLYRDLYGQLNDPYGYNSYDSYSSSSYARSTEKVVAVSFFFFILSVVYFILMIALVKTTSSRVFSIIGIIFTLIMTAWGIVVYDSPRSMSFDEVGAGWIIYGIFILIFSIVGTVQAFQYKKNGATNPPQMAYSQFQQYPYQQQYYPPQYPSPYPPQQQYQQPYQQPYQPPFPQQQQSPFPQQQQYPVQPPNYNQPPQYQQPPAPQNPFAPQDPPPPPFAPQEPPPPPFTPPGPANT